MHPCGSESAREKPAGSRGARLACGSPGEVGCREGEIRTRRLTGAPGSALARWGCRLQGSPRPSTPTSCYLGSPDHSSGAPFSDGAKTEGTPATHATEHRDAERRTQRGRFCGDFHRGEPPGSPGRAGSGASALPSASSASPCPCQPAGSCCPSLSRGRRRQPPRCTLLTLPFPGRVFCRAGLRQKGTSPRPWEPVPLGTGRLCFTRSLLVVPTQPCPYRLTGQFLLFGTLK